MKVKALCVVMGVLAAAMALAQPMVSIDEFEDGVYTDKWEGFNHMTNRSESAGMFSADTTGGDPYMRSRGGVVSLAASSYPVIELSMKNESGSSTSAQLFWTGTPGGWSEANSEKFTTVADGKFHTYRIDLSDRSSWNGTINAVRIDPTATASKHLDIHHLRALPATPYDTIDEFNDGSTSPWSFTNINPRTESGGTLNGTASATDPYMSRSASIESASHLELKLRMKVQSGAAQGAQVFWTGDWVGGWTGANSQTFPTVADGQWHTYTIPLNAHTRWRGPITGIRIDPFQTPALHTFELDYFRASQVGDPSRLILDDFDNNDISSQWNIYNVQNRLETTMDGVGYFYGETSTTNTRDPILQGSANANFPASMYQLARVVMAHDPDSEGSQAQIFWHHPGEGYAGNRYVNFPVITDGEFHEYFVNLGAHALWDPDPGSMIQGLRLDPIDGSVLTAGRWFKIDSFEMLTPEPGTLTLLALGVAGLVARRRKR